MNLFHYYKRLPSNRRSNLIAHKRALANALPDKEPASDLNNYDSVDSHILHGSLRPLEGESVLGEVADALEHAAHVGGGHQLHLRQPHHVGNAWLREPQQHGWALGDKI